MGQKYSFRKSRRGFITVMFSATALCLPAGALAGQVTTTIAASIVIESGCTVTANALVFPPPHGSGTTISKTTQIDVTCTSGTTFEVGIDAGLHSADVAARKMEGPSAATITYSIYRDNLNTLVWGNTQGVNTVSGTGDGSLQEFVAYGFATRPVTVPAPGTYTDIVTVYVYF